VRNAERGAEREAERGVVEMEKYSSPIPGTYKGAMASSRNGVL